MKKESKIRAMWKVTAFVIIICMSIAMMPQTSYGESDSQNGVENEYVVFSSYDLTEMEKPDGVADLTFAGSHFALVRLESEWNLQSVSEIIRDQFPDATFEPNYVYEATASDPEYSRQWGLSNVIGLDINFEEAEEVIEKNKGRLKETVVAVIDTGFDYSHEDLADNLWVNEDEIAGNGRDDDRNGYVDDVYGYNFVTYRQGALDSHMTSQEYNHGTHCAGIVGAVANNGIGVTGVAAISDKVSLMNLKVLGGREGTGTSFALIEAIEYAEKNGADICSISLGSSDDDRNIYYAMSRSNMLFVCASGNEGYNLDNANLYPGSYDLDNIICVTNINGNGQLGTGANYGSVDVDLAAPGTGIYSTLPGNRYGNMTGTSMSTPFVAGVAALVHSYYNEITPSEIRELLIETATPLATLTGKTVSGGYLNAGNALKAYSTRAFEADQTAPTITTSVSSIKGSYKQRLTITATDDSGAVTTVKYARGKRTKAYFRNGSGTNVSLDDESMGAKTLQIPGYYTVYASDATGNETIKYVRCTANAVSSIKLSATKRTIYRGNSYTLKATLSKSGTYGRKLTYISSDKSVATVSSSGRIRAKKKGTTTITVKTANGLTAKCKITVK